jgi:hypothetical protein
MRSTSSARPERAAEADRSMSRDEGGEKPRSVSATVRRSRSSVGARRAGALATVRLGAAFLAAARDAGRVALFGGAFLAAGFLALAFLAALDALFAARPPLAARRAEVDFGRLTLRAVFAARADRVLPAFLARRFAARGRAGARFDLLLAIANPL